jgi:hypothetical protein
VIEDEWRLMILHGATQSFPLQQAAAEQNYR